MLDKTKYPQRHAPTTDDPWNHMRRAQLRHERNRLIKLRVIIPSYATPPQLMVKVDGVWKPEIKTHVQVH